MDFIFELSYRLSSDDDDQDDIVGRLVQEECTDALIGIGHPGRIAMEFCREADDVFTAMTSALAAVRRAIPTAQLIEVRPDLVSLDEMPEYAEVDPKHLRTLAFNNRETFPAPVHAGNATLWHLDDVLRWMIPRETYQVTRGTLEVASIARHLNLAIQVRRIEPELFRHVQSWLV
ncbi:DNA-binding protein [Massilia rubra]|uniref:DNA-binding protein n=1 Tax=Massilia rubra TaxID=2607910 RepID=A0ABX0LQJ7_9BURK|nr:DNA-binding protein [Massilia rubra]NHZ34620.1 DNA-binding protein [Massilia rubra]